MNNHKQLEHFIAGHPESIGKLVFFDPKRHNLLQLDLTSQNPGLTTEIIDSTQQLSEWIFAELKKNKCKYGIGGYFEDRALYARSQLFNTTDETRSLHLGVDIWGDAETTVYTPIAGKVHSFQDNNNEGDYGPTVILEHDLDGLKLYSLYGHLSTESLMGLDVGMPMAKGEPVGHFGDANENGNWPPHLHFQLMFDMQGYKGDYPGACRISEREAYQQNIPDPGLILRFPKSSII
jgi:murein DD-endopeptidase MepM/ murein hydrolase activator NlpD